MNKTLKTIFKFYIEVDIIGPYLPREPSVINEDFGIERLGEVQIPKLDAIGTKLSTKSTADEVMLTLEYKEVTYNPAKFYLIIKIGSPDGNKAYYEAVKKLNNFCSLLSLTVLGSRYYYKIKALGMVPTKDFPMPFESPPSEPLLIVDYESGEDLYEEQKIFTKKVGLLLEKDKKLQKLLELFNQGLDSEYRQGKENEAAIIVYYKILEVVSNSLSESKSKVQKTTEYTGVINQLQDSLNNTSLADEDKLKIFRKTNTSIRKIDEDIISAKIEEAAKKFNLDNTLLDRLKKAIKLRNTTVAHANINNTKIELTDKRDLRELAKIFIINYVGHTHNESIEILNLIKGKGEHVEWHKSSYLNSYLRQKADDMGLI